MQQHAQWLVLEKGGNAMALTFSVGSECNGSVTLRP